MHCVSTFSIIFGLIFGQHLNMVVAVTTEYVIDGVIGCADNLVEMFEIVEVLCGFGFVNDFGREIQVAVQFPYYNTLLASFVVLQCLPCFDALRG